MCDLGYDGVCAVWREVPRIARVEHTCDGCGSVIHAGDAYLDHSHV